MHKQGQCTDLIDKTANELGDDVVTLMLVAVQRGNLELSVTEAIRRYVRVCIATEIRRVYSLDRTHAKSKQGIVSIEVVTEICIVAFPSLWVRVVMHCPALLEVKEY
jgi:hypothetical protein